jgi:hypothetical protein
MISMNIDCYISDSTLRKFYAGKVLETLIKLLV